MTDRDDDRSARSQVTLRLDRDLLESIDELAGATGVDRTELVRRLLADSLARRRLEMALDDFGAGRRSAWSAAEAAGIDLYAMLDRITEAGFAYRVDPEAIEHLRDDQDPSPSTPRRPSRAGQRTTVPAEDDVEKIRAGHRPVTTRLLLVGESSPAGGTHFYRTDSNLFRATRDAFGRAFGLAEPPDGDAFLKWFAELGCWLVDLVEQPVDRLPGAARARAVEAGVATLAETIRTTQPVRIVVVLRRIASAVRRAAVDAGFDDRAIDVLPFPTRQWRPVYVDQLAGIAAEALQATPSQGARGAGRRSVAEQPARYGSERLHDVIADVLRERGNGWMTATELAREIAGRDLWRRPSDGQHPPPSQIGARVRSGSYTTTFQTSDLGIRLRDR